jgi:predicted transcriptional regulator
MDKTVKDVMHVGIKTCPANLTLGELTNLLVEYGVHAMFIENEQGSIVGVISDIDLLAGEWLFKGEESLTILLSVTAGELMSSPVNSIEVDATLQSVVAQMAERHIHRLLVTEAGEPVGVISVSDIVRALGHQEVVQRTVEEVMSRAIVVCRVETPLHAVARGMSERRSRSVIVVTNTGAPKGIITGLDLVLLANDHGIENKLASEIMHAPITISPQASLREAADTMITHRIHRLLVTDPQQPDTMPMGIISTSDIMIEMAQPGSTWQ